MLKEILKDTHDNKMINKIKEMGYDGEQADAIYKATSLYSRIIDFVDPSFSVSEINDVLEFFKYEDASSINYIVNLEPSKRILMVKAYNLFINLNPKGNFRTFRLVYDVALQYDVSVLKVVIEKLVTNTPDYEFLNTVKKAMDQNANLYDLKYFEGLGLKSKEI